MPKRNHVIRRYYLRNANYFSRFADTIAEKNWMILRRVCLIAFMLIAAYFLLALFAFREASLLAAYGVYLALSFCLSIFVWRRKSPPSNRVVRVSCLAFILLVLAFILMISVFPYPSRPAIFYPIVSLALSFPFILPSGQSGLLFTGMEAVFLLLSGLFKTVEAFNYDAFSSVTAWILTLVIVGVVQELRLREGEALTLLEIASSTDVTTTLPNRRTLNHYLENRFALCSSEQQPIAVLLLDLDNFKAFNDQYGHVAGDACLSQIGTALREYADAQGVFAARYGGEELVAVAIGEAAERYAVLAEDIRRLVEGCSLSLREGKVHITASIGGDRMVPQPADTYLDLLKRADAALYRAKAAGKNRVVLFSAPG